jgi:hypothetical protein
MGHHGEGGQEPLVPENESRPESSTATRGASLEHMLGRPSRANYSGNGRTSGIHLVRHGMDRSIAESLGLGASHETLDTLEDRVVQAGGADGVECHVG